MSHFLFKSLTPELIPTTCHARLPYRHTLLEYQVYILDAIKQTSTRAKRDYYCTIGNDFNWYFIPSISNALSWISVSFSEATKIWTACSVATLNELKSKVEVE